MKRAGIIFLGALLLFFSFSACSDRKQDAISLTQKVTMENGFTYFAPEDWKQLETEKGYQHQQVDAEEEKNLTTIFSFASKITDEDIESSRNIENLLRDLDRFSQDKLSETLNISICNPETTDTTSGDYEVVRTAFYFKGNMPDQTVNGNGSTLIYHKNHRIYVFLILLQDASGGYNRSFTDTFMKKIESAFPEKIEDFEAAQYDLYNAPDADTGDLAGTYLYTTGVIKEKYTTAQSFGILLEGDQGENWVIQLGEYPLSFENSLEELLGKRARICFQYDGFSEIYSLPSGHLPSIGSIYLTETEKEILPSAFNATLEQTISWMDQYSPEIPYPDIDQEENKNTFKKISGIVTDMTHSEIIGKSSFVLYQNIDGKFIISEVTLPYETFPTDDGEKSPLSELTNGDSVIFYLRIKYDGSPQYLSMKKTEPAFTMEDLIYRYKAGCKPYTFEEIARNPDKVTGENAKLTGKVVQVMESGDFINLRVNITKEFSSFYTDTVYVTYKRKSAEEDRILEDDIVTLYGTLAGTHSYTSVLDSTITLPYIKAEYIDIHGKTT